MMSTVIPVDKIREVIGSGGKVIQKICAECDVKMDVEEDGHVFISGLDKDNCQRALTIVDTIVNDPEPGAFYNGKVTRIMDFGAFVEIAPGKEGLVHISRLDVKRTEKVTDVVNVGDEVMVKVLEIDDKGRLNSVSYTHLIHRKLETAPRVRWTVRTLLGAKALGNPSPSRGCFHIDSSAYV